MYKTKLKYRIGQKINYLTRFTNFHESKSEKLVYDYLQENLDVPIQNQKWIDNYRLDIFIQKYKLIIEVDGIHHLTQAKKDKKRDKEIYKNYRFKTIRIKAENVYKKNGLKNLMNKIHLQKCKQYSILETIYNSIFKMSLA